MRIFRWPWLFGACLLLVAGCGGGGGGEQADAPLPPDAPSPFQVVVSPKASLRPESALPESVARCAPFRDVHEEAGLEHVYLNGERGQCLMVETIGAGAGWLDYDADGHWDLYLTQGGDPTVDADATQPHDALFRNLGDGTFQDVTAQAAIAEFRYSQAVAVGDYDNDGFDDVYVTNVGRNTLYHNQGDGTFLDVTESAGVGDERWSASAAWADLDLDGDLDLYVCNYCVYDPKHPMDCRNDQGEHRVCHPRNVEPWPDECYINRGDGTFSAEAAERGLFGDGNRALGVAVADFNNDGLPDIYVTNDTTANFLFVNQGDGMFQEMGTFLGCAVDRNGGFQASMGVAVNDFDHNGCLDLYVTHFYRESNTLYRNYGEGGFQDETGLLGLHSPTLLRLAFGTVMADFNLDGRQELFVTTGHIENFPGNPLHRMSPQIFAFDGNRWSEGSEEAGEFFQRKYVVCVAEGTFCDFDKFRRLTFCGPTEFVASRWARQAV
ncbi:MAG: VCBS repeat-containing protein [Planctomycetota bacterium]